MSTQTLSRPVPAPGPKHWTVREFHRLWEQGFFNERKAILLDGEIIDMPIPGPLHNKGVGKGDYALKRIFLNNWVRVQVPLELNLWTDPVPDLSVVDGTPDDYDTNPSTALLAVEVSDTMLSMDLLKALFYAAAGIPEYWIVDLNNRILIVHRDPQPDATSTSGFRFQYITRLDETANVSPLALPSAKLDVSELLPRP